MEHASLSGAIPQIDFSTGPNDPAELKDDQDGASSASELDNQRALEVVFDGDDAFQRGSSAEPDTHLQPGNASTEKRKTACFVHSLLDKQRERGIAGSTSADDKRADKGPPSTLDNGARSRLLTKKQLSDMARGVRQLSKKLGSIKIKLHVRTVFILTKAYDTTLIGKTRELVLWLLSDKDALYTVYVEDTLKENAKFDAAGIVEEEPTSRERLKYWDNELASRHPHKFDFVVTLGGDGTLLYASWLFQRVVPPVLSFSLGSLGFLTKFDFADYKATLTHAFSHGVTVSLRLRFEGTVMRTQHKGQNERDLVEELVGTAAEDHHTHRAEKTFEILNDIVVDRGPSPTMSTIELFGDNEHFTTIQSDGVCVATPTGSTAYNLAAGGSLCHPENPVILVTAICAHTLSFRPIILPDTIVLRLGVPYDARTGSWASFDGRERVELDPGDYVTISASRYPFANVMQPGTQREDWVNSISRTLNWNSRQRQKAFVKESG